MKLKDVSTNRLIVLPGAEGFTRFLQDRHGPLEIELVDTTPKLDGRTKGRKYTVVGTSGTINGTYWEFDRFPGDSDFDRMFEGRVDGYTSVCNGRENCTSENILLIWEMERDFNLDKDGKFIRKPSTQYGFKRHDTFHEIPFPNQSKLETIAVNKILRAMSSRINNAIQTGETSPTFDFSSYSLGDHAQLDLIGKLSKRFRQCSREIIHCTGTKNTDFRITFLDLDPNSYRR